MLPSDFLVIGIIFGAVLLFYLNKILRSRRARQRVLKAGKAELAARKYLEGEGYTILSVQERVPIVTKINGKATSSHIQADLIVQKGKQVFVVDVKTGGGAQKPSSPDNRRQLLEYYLVYRTDGVLVLDMDNKKLYRMEFDINYPAAEGTRLLPYLLTFFAGFLVALILLKGVYNG